MDPKKFQDGIELQLNRRGFIEVNHLTGQTSVPWIFAGGDAALGPSSVPDAVGGGERGAVGIDEFLTGAQHAFWREDKEVDTAFDPDVDPMLTPRGKVRELPVGRRKHSFCEVELAWSEGVAVREARRCLRCDYRAKE
jgi:NADH-quinone oxidoreductase subunit F